MPLRWTNVLLLATTSFVACSRPEGRVPDKWNPESAAQYLDARQISWMAWPGAARDHGTFCISCHTVLPYVLARPALQSELAEKGAPDAEQKIIENVSKRVRMWSEVGPYYSGDYQNAKPAESRGTEAILNALILARYDAPGNKLADLTRIAFNNMWALQLQEGDNRGAWNWLDFGLQPWEATDSRYYGATLAALAIGIAPEDYHSSPDIQKQTQLLIGYLNRDYTHQSLLNRTVLLWASTKLPGILTSEQQKSIVRELVNQQHADGGWELSKNAWPDSWDLHTIVRKRLRSDWSRQSGESDGYATGLVTLVLQEAGMSRRDKVVNDGIAWLEQHQRPDGSWYSSSLKKRRNESSIPAHFMPDAATAYAVMALSKDVQARGANLAGANPRQYAFGPQ